MLSDLDILRALRSGQIALDPFNADRLQPASVDLTLGDSIRRPAQEVDSIDVACVPHGHTTIEEPVDGAFLLGPGQVALGFTAEVVTIGRRHVARVEGKSSLARLWLSVHVTGGFIDPGFSGHVTLEIVNMAPWSISLRPGMPICQVAFDALDGPPTRTYEQTGRYQGQRQATESRYTM